MQVLFGYNERAKWLTLEQLLAVPTIAGVHPEVTKRTLAMIEASGNTIGIGEGSRTRAAQLAEFIRRHELDPNGPIVFEGMRWSLREGMSPLGPPDDRSYHLPTLGGKALAFDLTGNLVWANANCHLFGLRSFEKVGAPGKTEPWHHQPVEIPTARSTYNANPSGYPLSVWAPATVEPVPPLPSPPGTPPEEDEDDDMNVATNAEQLFDSAPKVAKFFVRDDGTIRMMSPAEWHARGSQVGNPLTNEDIGLLWVEPEPAPAA